MIFQYSVIDDDRWGETRGGSGMKSDSPTDKCSGYLDS